MVNANLYALFASNFPSEYSAPCLIAGDGTPLLTYEQVDQRSAELAGLLTSLGLSRGDRAVVQADKSPHALLLYLACLRRGVIFIPLNTAYTGREVEAFLQDSDPSLLVCRPGGEADLSTAPATHVMTLAADGSGSLMERAAVVDAEPDVAVMSEDDAAAILYTSGTTGRSKGAMLTHRNLSSNALALTETWGWRRDDVLLHALPIYHAHGLFVGVHLSLLNGTAMIFLPRFTAEEVITNLSAATVFMGVPTFYTRLLACKDFNREACVSMRLFISGSAPLLGETFREFEARTGLKILERYGMTEALMITSNPLNGERLAGSVGYPLPGVRIRVVDDDGAPVPAGQVGELQITGPNVFKGYWRQPDKTAAEFTRAGYFRTGDLAMLSASGRVTLVGRNKDLIISGGLNVYPKEVENAIELHESVIESAVIGIPHPDFGEAVLAVIVPAGATDFDEEDLDIFLRDHLAGFKQPKKYVTARELPRNTMGKVQKNLLREQYANYFTA